MIGEKLKELLEQRGMRQTDLADMLGVPRTTINSIIVRNNKSVNFSLMEDIADALGVPIEYFGEKKNHGKIGQPIITDELSEKELDFVREYRALTPSNRRMLIAFAKFLLQEQEAHLDSQNPESET